jgi:hypothetical protein
MLEGWAVVDNLSGEDWKDVVVGVGSSSAMSFRYDLWSVRTVDRAELSPEEAFAIAPPTAVSPYGGAAGPQVAVQNVLTLDADEIRGNATLTEDYTKNLPVGRTFEAVLGTAAGDQGDRWARRSRARPRSRAPTWSRASTPSTAGRPSIRRRRATASP